MASALAQDEAAQQRLAPLPYPPEPMTDADFQPALLSALVAGWRLGYEI